MRDNKIYVENIDYPIKLQWDKQLSDFTYMFSDCESITSAYMHDIFGDNCDLSYMFKDCIYLQTINYTT